MQVDNSNEVEFGILMREMAVNYNKKLNELAVEAYWHELNGLSLDIVRRAVVAAMGAERFMPTGRKILEYADQSPTQEVGRFALPEGECRHCRGTVTIPYFQDGYIVSGRCTFCSRSQEIVTRIRDGKSYKEHRWAHGLLPWTKATGRERSGTYEEEWAKVQAQDMKHRELAGK